MSKRRQNGKIIARIVLNYPFLRKVNKDRSLIERNRLLNEAASRYPRGITLHIEGGMALDNPNIKRLINQGFLEIKRGRVHHTSPNQLSATPKWSKRFKRILQQGHRFGEVNITYAVVTDKGVEHLAT